VSKNENIAESSVRNPKSWSDDIGSSWPVIIPDLLEQRIRNSLLKLARYGKN
jgi:hypothetical protein